MDLTAAQEDEYPPRNITPAEGENEVRTADNISRAARNDSHAGSTSKITDIVSMCTCIGIGTLLGLLSRTGIIIVSNELLKTELSGIVWSNFVACFCMGLFVKASSMLALPKDHNVYLGLTTGYCGTFSSFSSAALEIFNAAAGRNPNQPPAGNTTVQTNIDTPTLLLRNISDFAGSTFVHIGVSFIGYHVGDTTASLIFQARGSDFLLWSRRNFLALTMSSISVSILVIIASLMETFLIRSFNFFIYVCFALVFALPGTSLRYFLSKQLNFDKRNNQKRTFPLGTFIANALGSLVLATTTLLNLGMKPNHSSIKKDSLLITSELSCCILSAIGHGFCGALTTMSTFIAELSTMTNHVYIYVYAVSSVFVTVGSFVVVWGTYSWSIGYARKSSCL